MGAMTMMVVTMMMTMMTAMRLFWYFQLIVLCSCQVSVSAPMKATSAAMVLVMMG
jgi:hypothetical protein